LVRQHGNPIAFLTLWESGMKAEVEVDLMRYLPNAPSGIMRFALIEAMQWAKTQGYSWFALGAAPLSGIRVSAGTPIWNQMAVALRGAGERYYNFHGVRDFKEWFYPEWEPTYLVSPGGAKRPIILANISTLISGSVCGAVRK
jgi:phosphatidylglycerol lysyltransferase